MSLIAIDPTRVLGVALLLGLLAFGGWYATEGPGSRGGSLNDLFAREGDRGALEQFRLQARTVSVGDTQQAAEDKMGRPADKGSANARSRELVWKGPLGATLIVTVEMPSNHVSSVDLR